jgi:hypothetical protein
MTSAARQALNLIRACVEAERFVLTTHFIERMDERGVVWPDLLTALETSSEVRFDGPDDAGRDKWLVAGLAADGLDVELVCVLDEDEFGHAVVFITVYWE